MPKLNVLVAGSTGYIGIQLVKLLIKHNNVKIKYLCGNTSVGKKISFFDKSLNNEKLPKIVKFNKKFLNNVHLIFTALPNGEAQDISKEMLTKNTLIDLAADFRLNKASEYPLQLESLRGLLQSILLPLPEPYNEPPFSRVVFIVVAFQFLFTQEDELVVPVLHSS